MRPTCYVFGFTSRREAMTVLALLVRTSGMPGRTCWEVSPSNGASLGKRARTVWTLLFLQDEYRKVHAKLGDYVPTNEACQAIAISAQWFARGYLASRRAQPEIV